MNTKYIVLNFDYDSSLYIIEVKDEDYEQAQKIIQNAVLQWHKEESQDAILDFVLSFLEDASIEYWELSKTVFTLDEDFRMVLKQNENGEVEHI